MTIPVISAIIVNWNRKNLLEQSLKSLLRQTIEPEIIVVDNGSTDGSVLLAQRYPQVRWILNAENHGFCRANNQAMGLACGQFIALLNNDAEAAPRWLEMMMPCFEPPDVGMVACKILVYNNPAIIDKAGHLIYPDGQNRGRGTGERDRGQFDQETEVIWPDGCAAMYRKAMLDQIGGFDEDFFAYGDDAELGLRARRAGWRCLYTPKAVVLHHRASTLGVNSSKRIALIERNRVLLAVKHFPASLLWLNLYYYGVRLVYGFIAAARNQGEAAFFPGARGKWSIAWGLIKGDAEAIRLLPRMLRKRAACRNLSKLGPAEVRKLILQNRIPLRELTLKDVIP